MLTRDSNGTKAARQATSVMKSRYMTAFINKKISSINVWEKAETEEATVSAAPTGNTTTQKQTSEHSMITVVVNLGNALRGEKKGYYKLEVTVRSGSLRRYLRQQVAHHHCAVRAGH